MVDRTHVQLRLTDDEEDMRPVVNVVVTLFDVDDDGAR